MGDVSASTRLIKKNKEFCKKHDLPNLRDVFDANMGIFKPLGFKHLTDRFDPKWFQPARLQKEKNSGKYTRAPYKSKAYIDFWEEELRRCKEGYKTHGYFCPGDLYFFLNYYTLPVVYTDPKTGRKERDLGHPNFWDVHYYWSYYVMAINANDRDGGVCLKPRGVGWSEFSASMGNNRYTTSEASVTLYTASQQGYLTSDGIMTKVGRELNWLNENTQRGFKRIRMKKNSPLHYRASKLDKEGNEKGWMSEIIGKVIDSPDKLRGIRTNLLVFEEAGSFKNLKKCVMTARALISVGGVRFGTMIVFGTGGDESANGDALEGLRDMFLSPDAYNFLSLKSNYNERREWTNQGFFFAAYEVSQKFMNGQGITDIEKAYDHFMKSRKKLEEAGAVKELIQEKAEYCFIPEDAFMQAGTNVFDRIKISNQRLQVLHNKDRVLQAERGELEWVRKKGSGKITGVEFIPSENGRILVWEKPREDKYGKVYKNLYIGGIDSIDQGTDNSLVGDKGSNFAAVVKKRFLNAEETHDMYVAEYVDRPTDERIAYEISLKMAVYYNLKWNVERTKKEIISYYRHQKVLNKFIVHQPSIISNDVSNKRGSNAYGTPINEKVILHYINRIKQYIIDFSDIIYGLNMLDELLNYSDERKTKFDRVAAMGMCELLDEDIDAEGLLPKSEEKVNEEMKPWGYYTDSNGYKRFGPLPEGGANSLESRYSKLELEKPDDLYADGSPEEEGIHFTSAEEIVEARENNLRFDLD